MATGTWVPPWGRILLTDVFCQFLGKDPGEEATGQGTTTFLPSGLTASSAGALQVTKFTAYEKGLASRSPAEPMGPGDAPSPA